MLVQVLISAGLSLVLTVAFQVYYRKQDLKERSKNVLTEDNANK